MPDPAPLICLVVTSTHADNICTLGSRHTHQVQCGLDGHSCHMYHRSGWARPCIRINTRIRPEETLGDRGLRGKRARQWPGTALVTVPLSVMVLGRLPSLPQCWGGGGDTGRRQWQLQQQQQHWCADLCCLSPSCLVPPPPPPPPYWGLSGWWHYWDHHARRCCGWGGLGKVGGWWRERDYRGTACWQSPGMLGAAGHWAWHFGLWPHYCFQHQKQAVHFPPLIHPRICESHFRSKSGILFSCNFHVSFFILRKQQTLKQLLILLVKSFVTETGKYRHLLIWPCSWKTRIYYVTEPINNKSNGCRQNTELNYLCQMQGLM